MKKTFNNIATVIGYMTMAAGASAIVRALIMTIQQEIKEKSHTKVNPYYYDIPTNNKEND